MIYAPDTEKSQLNYNYLSNLSITITMHKAEPDVMSYRSLARLAYVYFPQQNG